MVDQFPRGVKSVEFIGEEGVCDGPREEWFSEVASEIFDPALCLFELNDEDESYYMKLSEAARYVVNFNRMLKAVGRFIALSIIESKSIGVPLPIMYFAYLIGDELFLEDIREDEQVLYRSLRFIVGARTEELEMAAIRISVEGSDKVGTVENRADLIHQKIN